MSIAVQSQPGESVGPRTSTRLAKPVGQDKAPNLQTTSRVRNAAKNLLTLLALQLLLPITLAAWSAAWFRRFVLRRPDPYRNVSAKSFAGKSGKPFAGKSVLISGGKMTKALQLARSFKRAGLRVVLCETPPYAITSHRFSRCVDKFVTTPSPDDPDYSTRLVELVRQESIDFYVPVCSPVASLHDSFARRELDTYCEVIHPSPQLIGMLDDKFRLAKAAEKIGLGACESHLITDAQQVIDFDFANKTRPFILKSIKYDSVRRLDLTPLPRPTKLETEEFVSELPIAPERPWVLQEYIPGLEFCTHSTARGGQLRLHVCCESSPFQVNYDPVDEPEVEAWVREFIDHYCLDGQISFDFIRADDDQKLYVIECNPRTHSAITAFHDHPHVAEAYLGGERESDSLPVTVTQRPLASAKPTFWMVHELWRIVSNLHRPGIVSKRLAVIRQGKDAVFDWNDPAPFFMLHHFHIPMLLLRDVWQNRGWIRVDFNIGKLVQPGGD